MKQLKLKAKKDERGYALVAVLALLTIMAILLLAAAPTIQHEVQRQKEIEAIARGEEVAAAIRQYVVFYQGRKFPRKMEDLLEGLPQGTKKRQILRESAAIDPLTKSGRWKLVLRREDKNLLDFQKKVFTYNNGSLPPTQNQQFFNDILIQFTQVKNLDEKDEEEPAGGEDDSESDETEGDFVGVVSRSQRKSILGYYGIERHDRWVFTPLFR